MKQLLALSSITALALFINWFERTPKGIRNNNPLNIRGSNAFKWQGEIDRDYQDFVIFDSPDSGFRAAGRTLKTYRDKHGLNTIHGIVGRWAPPNENNTESYINSVSKKTGIEKNTVIETEQQYAKIVAAMAYHENGQNPFELGFIQTNVARGLA